MSDLTDSALMARIAQRDEAALSALYERYSARVYGLTLYILRDPAMAEEAAQDTFLKLWQQAHQWQAARSTLPTWLLTIARYTAVDRLRRESRQPTSGAIPLEDLLNLMAEGDDGVLAWADRTLMNELLRQLPADQIEAIEMAFFHGLSHAQIAQQTGTPLGTIKSRIRGGLQTLRGLWLRATAQE